ncbi:MAG: hypothetical protein H6907_11390 [Hyphomicrobiales bacterium]|nr:hypothetical protein [Hyphomicrobiales bacterium]MCP5372325.1 hypothetical protein [Hyphomicrobiales bacterium]
MVDIKGLGIGPAPLVPQYRVSAPGPRKVGDGVDSRPSPTDLQSQQESAAAARGVVNSRALLSEPLTEPPSVTEPRESSRRLGNETRLALDEFLLQVFRDIGYPPSIAEAKAARLTGSVGLQTVAVASALDQRLKLLGFESGTFSTSVRLESAQVTAERTGAVQVTIDNLALRVEVRDDTGFLLLSKQLNLKEEAPSGIGNPRGLPGEPVPSQDFGDGEDTPGAAADDPVQQVLAETFGADNLRRSDGTDSFQVRINRILASDQEARADATDTAEAAQTTEKADVPLDGLVAGAGLSLDA